MRTCLSLAAGLAVLALAQPAAASHSTDMAIRAEPSAQEVEYGSTFTITITARNNGTSNAWLEVFFDPSPRLTVRSVTGGPFNEPCSYQAGASSRVRCASPQTSPGGTMTMVVELDANVEGGVARSTMDVHENSGIQGDRAVETNPADNNAEVSVNVLGAPDPTTGAGPGRTLVERIGVSRRSFRAARRGPSVARAGVGTRVSYALSSAARTTWRVERRRRKRWVKVRGSFQRPRASRGSFLFRGRMGGRALKPGRYRLVATAPGGRSRRAPFQIVR